MAQRIPRDESLSRVHGVGALFSAAYGNVGSSIYYALGVTAAFALGLTPIAFVISGLIFAGLIALITFAHYRLGLGAVVAFWLAYILTRPLGASLGDLLSQPRASGGLGLGTTATSFIFLATILVVVTHSAPLADRFPRRYEMNRGTLEGIPAP